jgi:hypothetical protein
MITNAFWGTRRGNISRSHSFSRSLPHYMESPRTSKKTGNLTIMEHESWQAMNWLKWWSHLQFDLGQRDSDPNHVVICIGSWIDVVNMNQNRTRIVSNTSNDCCEIILDLLKVIIQLIGTSWFSAKMIIQSLSVITFEFISRVTRIQSRAVSCSSQ